MSKFILAFKRFLNLLKFKSPSSSEIAHLKVNEAILHIEQSSENYSLIATFNTGETLELLTTDKE